MKPSWDRCLWGVIMTGAVPGDPPNLLGEAWSTERHKRPHTADEPSRTLLFNTRRQARQWCADRNAGWHAKPDMIMSKWHVKPVRVRELVAPVDKAFGSKA